MSLPIPQAPDIETLYMLEGQINPAIYGELRDRGIFDVDQPRGKDEGKTPRVEFQLQIREAISWTKIPAGGTGDRREVLPVAWNCAAVFTVVTDRNKNDMAHDPMLGRVRLMVAQFWTGVNTRLPYHLFEKLAEGGTTPGMINEDARTENISRIVCPGIVKIRDKAWPAGS